ncbi:MAG: hypothetical protein KBS81_04285, partial [Spirochaetales bacterium]|nr:hypothetical protein [Candidatus Physcosoma equi]
YINMAGGYTNDAKKLGQSVVDMNGDKLKHVEYVPAESTITVPVSTFRTDLSTALTVTSLVINIFTIIAHTTGLLGK